MFSQTAETAKVGEFLDLQHKGHHIRAYMRRLRLRGVYFFKASDICKVRPGLSQVEVYERGGNPVSL